MKKILIALLSLAMLFSFVACDNSNTNPSDTETTDEKTIVALTATPKEGFDKYFKGDKLDKGNYTFVGTQNNGNPVEIDPSQIMAAYVQDTATETTGFLATTGADNADVKAAVVAKFTYNGPFQPAGPVSTTVKATVYTMSAFDVTGTSSKTYYVDSTAEADKTVSKDDFTVTGYAYDANKAVLFERELADDQYEVSGSLAATGKVEITFAPVEAYGDDIDATKTGADKATINVERDYVTAIDVVLKSGNDAVEAIVGAGAEDASEYVDVMLTYKSGAEKKDDGTVVTDIVWSGSTFTTGSKFTSAAQGITATYGELTDSVNVETTVNYIKSFKVTGTVEADKKIKVSDLSVSEVTWADELNEDTQTMTDDQVKTSLRMNGAETFDTTGYEANDKLPITFTIDGQPKAKATADSVVTIKAAASGDGGLGA